MPAQDHYLEPAIMTEPGTYQPLFADLPRGIAGVAGVTHGLLIHEHLTGAYGFTLTDERRTSVHVRPVAGLLGRMMAEDDRPLTSDPDAPFADLTAAYATDPRLTVPATVYNAVLSRTEPVLTGDR